jgi:DNA-binding transcriptional ArsR family regulator
MATMAQSRYDLILHPVRLQILHALEGNRRMSMRQLEARLADVSPATLSRQVDVLIEGGMVVREMEGTEPVFRAGETMMSDYDKHRATPADHLRYFTTFVAGLIASFTRYTKRPDANVVRDRVAYRQRTLFLTDKELTTLIDDLEARFDREEDDPANPERRPHVISWVILPESQPREEV